MKKIVVFIIVFYMLSFSSFLLAGDKEKSRFHNLKALSLIKKKKYEVAIQEFQIAFFLYPTSKSLINIAKTYELIKRPDLAIDYFKMSVTYSHNPTEKKHINRKISELQQSLLQKKTFLKVNTPNVAGAELTLYKEGKKKSFRSCLSPCELWVPENSYRLVISKKGYELMEDEFQIPGHGVMIKNYSLKQIRVIGILDIKSYPKGSKVFINNRFKATAPANFEMKPGKYMVRIESHGYQPWEKNITLSANETEHFYVVLDTLEDVLLKQGKVAKSNTGFNNIAKEKKKKNAKKEKIKQNLKVKNKSKIKIVYKDKIITKEKIIYKKIGKSSIPHYLKWILWGIGAASLGSGGYLYYNAVTNINDANSLPADYPDYTSGYINLYKQGKNYERNSFLLFGVGGISVIVGTLFYLLEPSEQLKTRNQ